MQEKSRVMWYLLQKEKLEQRTLTKEESDELLKKLIIT